MIMAMKMIMDMTMTLAVAVEIAIKTIIPRVVTITMVMAACSAGVFWASECIYSHIECLGRHLGLLEVNGGGLERRKTAKGAAKKYINRSALTRVLLLSFRSFMALNTLILSCTAFCRSPLSTYLDKSLSTPTSVDNWLPKSFADGGYT